MPPIFAICDRVKPQLDLGLDNILHSSVLDAGQLLLMSLAVINVGTRFEKLFRAE